jgi:hypothetical protein
MGRWCVGKCLLVWLVRIRIYEEYIEEYIFYDAFGVVVSPDIQFLTYTLSLLFSIECTSLSICCLYIEVTSAR